MANTTLNMQLLLRRDQVFTSTYVLAAGEPGFEISTNTFKVGDGTKTWAELPIANKAQIDALTDAKLAGYKPLQEAIDAVETDANVFVDTVAQDANGKITITTKAVDFSAADDRFKKIQTAVSAVATAKNVFVEQIAQDAQGVITITTKAVDFSDYRTSADQDAIDATLATKEALEAVTDELDTYGDIVTHNVAEFATAAQGAKADAAAVKTDVDAALLLKADKSVVDAMYTNSQIDGFIADAKKYADDNDSDTKYGIAYDSDSKKITLVEGGTNFEIDATDFIKDGMIDTVTIGDDNDLVITFNTAAGKDDIRLPLDQLVDIYTGSTGGRIVVTVASDKSISAELVAGSISKNYLDTAVQTSLGLADSALQAADLSDYAKTADVVTNDEFTQFETTNNEAIGKKLDKSTFDAFNNGASKTVAAIEADIVAKAGAAESAAKGHADSLNTAMDGRVAKLENNEAGYATKDYVDTQDADILAQAKAYADGKDHKNTTYTVAPTANALEFTVTPSEGDAQTVTLVAPVVDTGVMSIEAGNDIVVTPGESGKVTIAHETYGTGEYTAPEVVDDTKFVTGVNVKNGHVVGAQVKSLADALSAMTFIFDGGRSSN